MEKLIVRGGRRLFGTVRVSGAKNAVLPVIAATLLGTTPSTLEDIPDLEDVRTIAEVLEHLGASVRIEPGTLYIDCTKITALEAPYELVRKMRASFLVMGPLLAREGCAKISLPGGCAIGTRPIDLHLKGFEALGAEIITGHGFIEARAPQGLTGARIYLDFPSVGATENIMMAASMAKGQTIIENPAEEPEIVDLANMLNHMGANIRGAGTNLIRIEGVSELKGACHAVIPDRIEAGTYMVAAAMTGGDVYVENALIEHLKPVIAKLKEAGVVIEEDINGVRVRGTGMIRSVDIKTLPYPGFPTDMQAQLMALMTIAQGTSIVTETVFENRFMHVDELKRMGASIKIDGRSAVVEGVAKLTGCQVKATDLRAGAAMVLAGLVAEGQTEISYIHHIDRGYDNLVEKFRGIGADIERVG
ncbi:MULTISPECIES: UDP-N-acetylglucosamine 1-carboxyvinyltransferase [Sporomusa]|uniref:UDP-N-acetylglucosamine 1-carboxyvinyltransferase n=2 Tax=Sporomusa TaxID=2375 RepID=A0ABM9W4B5_9FIRM|nr:MULTISPECIES: UDP-N-acetylglucosamine 1-carboxyvinyltransferase [Sporomusa]MCM0757948.1 UDP-N-acetylglucosamine 1-carboxyvinyltransferase [Sporomusa sphaeroides DSM 2875]OLS55455.1 UDP-N-acetylglucosamine 1-carboxyvinyltransferase 1 [Sporomusa sphaeroides DSM 2875]CVK20008.1 UDP-N-acetylglucosamine 1-carboxyvinyltransferase 1 [Sporomusa sphaeroides DSM 2875]SCM83549.1 UDP-N-acetylglucosamine 1-carboxyvinyltransferase [uncultured Sporomusa sp.]